MDQRPQCREIIEIRTAVEGLCITQAHKGVRILRSLLPVRHLRAFLKPLLLELVDHLLVGYLRRLIHGSSPFANQSYKIRLISSLKAVRASVNEISIKKRGELCWCVPR